MNAPIDPREYGRLEQQVEQLSKDVHSLKEMVETMNNLMQQSRGGWKVIALIGGIAGSVGAAVAWGVSHIKVN